MAEELVVSHRGPCAVVRMNRPERRNALSISMLDEMTALLHDLERREDVRGIVLTGSDTCFSAGADLNDASDVHTASQFISYIKRYRDISRAIEESTLPVVAAISGYCITGGLELAMAADVRYAAGNATFAITSAKIGSVAGAGGTQRLPRLVGPGIAMELLFTGRRIDAAYAERIGLINRVVTEVDVVDAAVDLVTEIAQSAPLSVSWIKRAVHSGLKMDLDSALDFESSLCGNAFASADKVEGMRAFLEKRPPQFRGA